MSNLSVFAIYDSKAQYFMKPFNLRNKGEAIRGFSDIANDSNTVVGKHPEDFVLFHLGYFDEVKGIFENLTAPESLGIAQEFVKPEEADK